MKLKNRYKKKYDVTEFRILKAKHSFILNLLKLYKKNEDNSIFSKFIPYSLKKFSDEYFKMVKTDDNSVPREVNLSLNSLIFTDFIKLETISNLSKNITYFINKNFEVDYVTHIPKDELKDFEYNIKSKPYVHSRMSLKRYKVKSDNDLFNYAEEINLDLEYITGDIVFITFSVIPSKNIIIDYNAKISENYSGNLINFDSYKFLKKKIYFDHYIFSKEKVLLDYKREISWNVLKKFNNSSKTYLFNEKIEPAIIEVFQTNDPSLFEKDYFDFLRSIGVYRPNILGFKSKNKDTTFYYDGENISNSKILVSEEKSTDGFSNIDDAIFFNTNWFFRSIFSTLAINAYLNGSTVKMNNYQNKLMKLLNRKHFVHNRIIEILTDLNIETILISRFDFFFSIILNEKEISSNKNKHTTIHITQKLLTSTLNKIEMIIKMTNSRLEVENVKSTKKLSRRAIWVSIISTLIALSSTYGNFGVKWLDIGWSKLINMFDNLISMF